MKLTLRSFFNGYCCKAIILLCLLLSASLADIKAQTVLSTSGSFSNDTTVSTITFNFQNTNSYPVMITDMEGILATYGTVSITVLYKTSAINGPTGLINAANGWVSAGNAGVAGIENMTTLTMQPLLTGLTLTIPANTTYGIALSAISAASGNAAALRVGNGLASFSTGAGGCNVINGTNSGYATVAALPAEPTLSPKAWLGRIRFISAVTCAGTPNATTVSGPANICSGSLFNLSASGYSVGVGIQYQWQKYNTTTLAWEDVTGATTPVLSATITASTQFRFKTLCSSTSMQTTSPAFTVNIGSALPGGNYTINKNAASSSTNFVSFRAAAAAMKCGITGTVNLNVVPNSGPYTENVVFTDVPGTSATSRIRLNGNGNIIQFANTSVQEDSIFVVRVKGTKYFTIDSLTVRTLGVSYGLGIVFTDTASYDSVKRCFIDMRSLTDVLTNYNSGISLSGYLYNSSTYSGFSSNLYIGYNHILGTTKNNGMFAGILSNYGAYYDYDADTAIVIDHNDIENFSYYGIQSRSGRGSRIAYNDIHRENKASSNVFIGIICWLGQYNNFSAANNDEIKIIGNRIHHPRVPNMSLTGTFTGIQVYNYYYYTGTNVFDSSSVLIANNVIYGVDASTTSGNIWGIYTQTGNGNVSSDNDNIRIYHNTIDFSGLTANNSINIAGIYCYDAFYNSTVDYDSIHIKNNLVTLSGSNLSQPCYGFLYGLTGVSTNIIDQVDAQRNVFYNTVTPSSNRFYGKVGTLAYATMADFHTDYPGYENGSISVDPQYFSVATGDFTPQNLALYGNGVNLQTDVPVDINGRPRSANPTPGAFEIGADAGVANLLSPLGTYCSSIKLVKVSVTNYGLLPIQNLEVNWSLNGVLQTPVSYNGVLNANATVAVSLGNGLFLPNTPVTIKAWTSNPNSQPDANNANDTLVITTQSSTSVPVNIGPDDTICVGNTITLDAGYPGSTYLWDNNATTQTRTIQNAGTYYVRLTAYDGCIGVDTMKLSLRPLPVVDLGPDVEICEGTTYTFDAGHPGSTYVWDDGSTMQTRTVDTAGDYEAQVTDVHGCTGVDNVTVSMKDIPGVDGLNATHADSGFYTFYPLNPRYTINYTWNFGDGSPEVLGYMVQHQYANNGIYTVTLYLEGECTGLIVDKSRTVDVFNAIGNGSTGVNNVLPGGMISMYPNPANNLLQIENASDARMKAVRVFNVLGQQILAEKADAPKRHKLNTSTLSSGIYTIRIETDQGMYIQKFEVLR